MSAQEITLQDIYRLIQTFEKEDPFQTDYSLFSELMDKMNVARILWFQRVRGELVDEACIYDSGDASPKSPYIKNFPCNDELLRTVQVFRHEDSPPWTEQQMVAIKLFQELTFTYGSCTVLKQRAYEAQHTDPDTQIPSFFAYGKFVRSTIQAGRIGEYAALYVNIKNCKLINKFYSFPTATKVLAQFAKTCSGYMEADEIFSRLGGDNFMVLVKKNNLETLLKRLRLVPVAVRIADKKMEYRFSCRAGIYLADHTVTALDELMNRTARALTLTRQPQSEDYIYYDTASEKTILRLNELEVEMESAMTREDFLVYYQPKVSTRDKKLVGAEALIRWNFHGQTISPMEFIPVFERTGFIINVDFYMLNKVCQQLRHWLDMGVSPVPVSVNFSRAHLNTENLADRIWKVIQSYGLSPDYLEIEFTETAYVNETENLSRVVAELKRNGVSVSMDDFGSGYSSLCLLQDLMFDVLKIDKSLVGNVANRRKAVVLEHIIQMAKELRMYVVCEGVETMENLHFLENTSCDYIQGFLFDKPLPLEEFEKHLFSKHYTLEAE